jgi:hypothetical protein
MYLHSASCELRNPPPVRWRWISVETAVIAAVVVLASMFI